MAGSLPLYSEKQPTQLATFLPASATTYLPHNYPFFFFSKKLSIIIIINTHSRGFRNSSLVVGGTREIMMIIITRIENQAKVLSVSRSTCVLLSQSGAVPPPHALFFLFALHSFGNFTLTVPHPLSLWEENCRIIINKRKEEKHSGPEKSIYISSTQNSVFNRL